MSERNLNVIFDKCMNDVLKAKITPGTVMSVTLNPRFKSTMGRTARIRAGLFKIQIASCLMDERVPLSVLEDTIVHEILHTVDGCFNHGPTWKMYGSIMEREFGYHVTKYLDPKTLVVSEEELGIVNKPKYKITCKKCGNTFSRKRWSNICANPSAYRCAICHGDLKVESIDPRHAVLSARN